MRTRTRLLAAVCVSLAGCAGGASGPAVLGYAVPSPSALTYASGDTVSVDIEAGGQSFQVTQNASMLLETSFADAGEGVQVTMRVRDLAGRMTQPMGAPISADESGVQGPLVFRLDADGDVEVVSEPELSDEAGTFFSTLALAHTFFPALPARQVEIGDTWTDTLAFSGPQPGGEIDSRSIVAYTVTRDTVIAGRSVLRIDLTGTSEQARSGMLAGNDFTQRLAGDVEGYVLWDLSRGVMVESFADGTFRGNMEVAIAPFPLQLRVRAQQRARLAG